MARKFATNVDLDRRELRNAVLHPVASDPVSPVEGQVWFNTTDNTVRYFDGSQVIDLDGGSVASASSVTLTPTGSIAATTVQAAVAELDSEKAAAVHTHAISDVTNLQSSLDAKAASGAAVPIGGVIDYFGAVEPSGWFFPNGQAISRSAYPTLFAALGTTYGAGDGSTTFNLPDMRGRVGVMRDVSAGVLTGTDALGTVEGAQTVTLTGANLPSHDHGGSITSGGGRADFNAAVTSEGGKADFNAAVTSSQNTHSHNLTYNTVSNTTTTGTAQRTTNITTSSGANSVTSQSDTHSHTIAAADLDAAQADHTHQITAASLDAAQVDHTHAVTVPAAYGNGSGGTDAHQNMQPSIRVNKLIRAA